MAITPFKSFKVIDVGINRKPVCDFLLVINTLCSKKVTPKFKKYGKSLLRNSYTKTSVIVCAQSGHRLHGHTRVVEHATVELLVQ